MVGLLDLLQENPGAMIFGGLGLVCQLAWPLFGARKSILAVQFGIGANYGIQYALLGAWSGAGIACLGATQTLVALAAGERPWLGKIGLMFLPIVILVGIATWGGVHSLFALTACTLVMLGRLQQNTIALRLFLLAAAPFGIGYDVSVGAVVALCGAVSSAVIAATILVREVHGRRTNLRSHKAASNTVVAV